MPIQLFRYPPSPRVIPPPEPVEPFLDPMEDELRRVFGVDPISLIDILEAVRSFGGAPEESPVVVPERIRNLAQSIRRTRQGFEGANLLTGGRAGQARMPLFDLQDEESLPTYHPSIERGPELLPVAPWKDWLHNKQPQYKQFVSADVEPPVPTKPEPWSNVPILRDVSRKLRELTPLEDVKVKEFEESVPGQVVMGYLGPGAAAKGVPLTKAAAKAITPPLQEAGQILTRFPQEVALDTAQFGQSVYRKAGEALSYIPGVKGLIETLGGKVQTAQTGVEKAIVKHGIDTAMVDNAVGTAMTHVRGSGLQRQGFMGITKTLDIAEDGTLKGIQGAPKLWDVIQKPTKYALDPNQQRVVKGFGELIRDSRAMARQSGITTKELSMGRLQGSMSTVGNIAFNAKNNLGAVPGKPGAKVSRLHETLYETFSDMMAKGHNPLQDPDALTEAYIKSVYKMVVERRMVDRLQPFAVARKSTIGAKPQRGYPAIQNLKFDPEETIALDKYFGDDGLKWLRGAQTAAGVLRLLKTTADFSAPFIQGIPVLARHPDVWAKATGAHYLAWARPDVFADYVAQNRAVINEMIQNGARVGSGTEFYAQAPVIAQGLSKIPFMGKLLSSGYKQSFGRFETSFSSYGDIARIEMYKGLREQVLRSAKDPAHDLSQLGSYINKMTGTMDTRALGIGATQRQIENSFIFFAPSYTRASMSLVSDILRGGVAGQGARNSLIAMMTAYPAYYTGVSIALGQTPDFEPIKDGHYNSNFMTVKIGDQRVGLGGFYYSLLRLLSQSYATASENPEDFLSADRKRNPIVHWWIGRTSIPTAGALAATSGMLFEHDVWGRPLSEPVDWLKLAIRQGSPIPLEGMLLDNESPEMLPAEIAGLRTTPLGRQDRLDQFVRENAKSLRLQVTDVETGKKRLATSWEEVEPKQQRRLQESKKVQDLLKQAQIDTVPTGYDYYIAQRNKERDQRETYGVDAQRGFRVDQRGNNLPYTIDEYMSDVGDSYTRTGAVQKTLLDQDPEYRRLISSMEKRSKGKGSQALSKYYKLQEEHQVGGRLDPSWFDTREDFLRSLPQGVKEYVERNTGINRTEFEEKLATARQAITKSGFWDIRDKLAKSPTSVIPEAVLEESFESYPRWNELLKIRDSLPAPLESPADIPGLSQEVQEMIRKDWGEYQDALSIARIRHRSQNPTVDRAIVLLQQAKRDVPTEYQRAKDRLEYLLQKKAAGEDVNSLTLSGAKKRVIELEWAMGERESLEVPKETPTRKTSTRSSAKPPALSPLMRGGVP